MRRALGTLLPILGMLYPQFANSEHMFTAQLGGTVIDLHDDKCAMDAVSNLPFRATWKDATATFEGCWGVTSYGLVMMYFEDKTVAGVPTQVFKKLTRT